MGHAIEGWCEECEAAARDLLMADAQRRGLPFEAYCKRFGLKRGRWTRDAHYSSRHDDDHRRLGQFDEDMEPVAPVVESLPDDPFAIAFRVQAELARGETVAGMARRWGMHEQTLRDRYARAIEAVRAEVGDNAIILRARVGRPRKPPDSTHIGRGIEAPPDPLPAQSTESRP